MNKTAGLSIKFKLDVEKDAWNWWDACNNISHGMDWKQRIEPEIRRKIVGKSQKATYVFLIPYLENLYRKKNKRISSFINKNNVLFDRKLESGCARIELVMAKPIYRKDFTLYFTMFPRAPYCPKTGSIWFPYLWKDPMGTFLHELCHFQFIHYWRDKKTDVAKLSRTRFEFLKESLTVILDEDFLDLIEKKDQGYPVHKEFRTVLKKYWKANHNFEKLVEVGLQNLDKYC